MTGHVLMGKSKYPKPFNGAISKFFKEDAPNDIRKAIEDTHKNDILDKSFPYSKRKDRKEYEEILEDLQIELVKMQTWAKETGTRIIVVFEGRDAAGKGGTIKRFRENMNPRSSFTIREDENGAGTSRPGYIQASTYS